MHSRTEPRFLLVNEGNVATFFDWRVVRLQSRLFKSSSRQDSCVIAPLDKRKPCSLTMQQAIQVNVFCSLLGMKKTLLQPRNACCALYDQYSLQALRVFSPLTKESPSHKMLCALEVGASFSSWGTKKTLRLSLSGHCGAYEQDSLQD